MAEPLSLRRAQFLERWALTNAALLLSIGMVAGCFAFVGGEFLAALMEGAWKTLLPAMFLVLLPVNAAYLFCSAHIYYNQRWQGHRTFWIWLMIGAELWAFAITIALLFPDG